MKNNTLQSACRALPFAYPLMPVEFAMSRASLVWLACCSGIYVLSDLFILDPPFDHSSMNEAYLGSFSTRDVIYRTVSSLGDCSFIPTVGWYAALAGGLPMQTSMMTFTAAYLLGMIGAGLGGVMLSTLSWFVFAVCFAERRSLFCSIYWWLVLQMMLLFWAPFLIPDLKKILPQFVAPFLNATICTVYERLGWMAFTTFWRRLKANASPFIASIAAACIVTGAEAIRHCSLLTLANELHGEALWKEALKICVINVATVTVDRQQLVPATIAAFRGRKHVVDAEADLLLRSRWGFGYPPLLPMFFFLILHAMLGGSHSFARQISVWTLFAVNCGTEIATDILVMCLQRQLRYEQSYFWESLSATFIRLQQPWQHVASMFSTASSPAPLRGASTSIHSIPLNAACGLSAESLAGLLVAFVGIWTCSGAVGGTFAA